MERTAAIIVVGNEILDGSVVDTNSPWLASELHRLGVALRRIVVVPDDAESIAEAVRDLVPRVDLVFTSGGIGPTHDDVTIAGVARGLGRPVVGAPELVEGLRAHFGERLTEAHLRMAEVPEGARFLPVEEVRWPLMVVENLYVLPGIPQIFRRKFRAVRESLRCAPWSRRTIYLMADEAAIADALAEAQARHAGVAVGSYPVLGNPTYRIKLTIESRSPEAACAACDELLERLGQAVVRRGDEEGEP